MSVLVTHLGLGHGCGRSPGAPRARRGPAPPARGRGSTLGSLPWTASAADWPPCSRADRRSPSSTADGGRCVGRAGIIARNCDTCAAFECSSNVVLRPPMVGRPRTSTPPDATGRRRRSRSEEDALQRPFEEDPIEENDIFTPADLLLFQNSDGIPDKIHPRTFLLPTWCRVLSAWSWFGPPAGERPECGPARARPRGRSRGGRPFVRCGSEVAVRRRLPTSSAHLALPALSIYAAVAALFLRKDIDSRPAPCGAS